MFGSQAKINNPDVIVNKKLDIKKSIGGEKFSQLKNFNFKFFVKLLVLVSALLISIHNYANQYFFKTSSKLKNIVYASI